MIGFLKKLLGIVDDGNLKKIIDDGAFLVDVRTPGEFANGSVKNAVNIPLNELTNNIVKFKNRKNIVVFCQSGARSAKAASLLKSQKIANVTNGGGWQKVARLAR